MEATGPQFDNAYVAADAKIAKLYAAFQQKMAPPTIAGTPAISSGTPEQQSMTPPPMQGTPPTSSPTPPSVSPLQNGQNASPTDEIQPARNLTFGTPPMGRGY